MTGTPSHVHKVTIHGIDSGIKDGVQYSLDVTD
jgi:hypothetical protein